MKKHLVLFDVHCPAHNKKIINSICALAKDIQPHGLHFGGDFADLFTLGSYNADSLGLLRDWTLEEEYKQCNKLLDEIESSHNFAEKSFLYGNHEDRYFRERKKGDRDKYGNMLVSPTDGLNLKKRGYKVYENWIEDYIKIGKLSIHHGYYTNKHAAQKHLDAAQKSIMFGHTHRIQTHVAGEHGAWNVGFLGDINHKLFSYMHPFQRAAWANGFAVVNELSAKGDFVVEIVHVINNNVYYGGKKY